MLPPAQRTIRRTHVEANRDAEKNSETDAKLANGHRAQSVASSQRNSLARPWMGTICIFISYLQLTDFSDSSKTVRGTGR